MDSDTYRKRVGALTFRTYTTDEGDLIEELAAARIFQDLRTPWNTYYSILTSRVTADPSVQAVTLDRRTRYLMQVGVAPDETGVGYDVINRLVDEDYRDNTVQGWVPGEANEPSSPESGLANIGIKGYGAGIYVVVKWHGEPAQFFDLYWRYPMLYLWGGAVEGFQLQGDEQGRERALRNFAAELAHANDQGEMALEVENMAVRAY